MVIEKAGDDYSAFVPDLPDWIATTASTADFEMEIRAAIRFHIDGLRQDSLPVPEPAGITDCVEV